MSFIPPPTKKKKLHTATLTSNAFYCHSLAIIAAIRPLYYGTSSHFGDIVILCLYY